MFTKTLLLMAEAELPYLYALSKATGELGKVPNRLGGLCLRVVELFDLEAFGNNNCCWCCSFNSKCLLLNVIIYQYIEANPFFLLLHSLTGWLNFGDEKSSVFSLGCNCMVGVWMTDRRCENSSLTLHHSSLFVLIF